MLELKVIYKGHMTKLLQFTEKLSSSSTSTTSKKGNYLLNITEQINVGA